MAMRRWFGMGAAALVLAAGAGAIVIMSRPAPAPPAAVVAIPPPADCLLPGPPPVTPHGETATAEEMKQGRDNLQAFVLQLEAYQACRNAQIDHAAPSVAPRQKAEWLQQGNDAIDEANAIKEGFRAQRDIFNARNGTR